MWGEHVGSVMDRCDRPDEVVDHDLPQQSNQHRTRSGEATKQPSRSAMCCGAPAQKTVDDKMPNAAPFRMMFSYNFRVKEYCDFACA